ncbi:MAG: TIM barrel protein [Candidatus Aenigmatarchaeota archaeon]
MWDKIKEFFGISKRDKKNLEKMEPEDYMVETSTWPEGVGQSIASGVNTALHAGATIVELTPEHPTSVARHVKEELQTFIEQENLKINLHATMQLKTARAAKRDYEKVHNYLKGYLEVGDDLDCDYLNVHTSLHPSPVIGRITGVSRENMVDPLGKNMEDFVLEAAEENKELFYKIVDIHPNGTGIMQKNTYEEVSEYQQKKLESEELDDLIQMYKDKGLNEIGAREKARNDIREMANRILRTDWSNRKDLMDKGKETLRNKILDGEVSSFPMDRNVGVDELITYRIIAWKMYMEEDDIWQGICGNRDPETVEDEDVEKFVDAVAGKYVQGHIENLKDLIEKTDIKITLETPDAREREFIGYYRLVDPRNIYEVVKSIGNPLVRLCIDFEHIASHGINPAEALEEAPSRIGSVTYVSHISGAPVPGHQHKTIEKGDKGLYEMLWILRKKGFKKGYLNFERGGGGQRGQQGKEDPYQESIPILKRMAVYLEEDVPPDELPSKFYGYSDQEFKQEEAVVFSHTFDPLKGLIESPELSDTFLGKHAAVDKRMGEEWKKEEFQ